MFLISSLVSHVCRLPPEQTQQSSPPARFLVLSSLGFLQEHCTPCSIKSPHSQEEVSSSSPWLSPWSWAAGSCSSWPDKPLLGLPLASPAGRVVARIITFSGSQQIKHIRLQRSLRIKTLDGEAVLFWVSDECVLEVGHDLLPDGPLHAEVPL